MTPIAVFVYFMVHFLVLCSKLGVAATPNYLSIPSERGSPLSSAFSLTKTIPIQAIVAKFMK
jgi:hypothetical protein